MSETNETILRKPKTAAPMVLGVLGFMLSLPSTLCASMCAGLVSAATEGELAAGWYVPAVLLGGPLVNMIASFFCKQPASRAVGIVIILISLVFMLVSLVTGALLNIASAILFFVGGSLCIANASRPE